LCPDCAENWRHIEAEGKKRSAQINIAIFAIGGVLGAVLGVLIGPEIIGTIIGATTGHHGLPYTMMEPIAIVYTLLLAYLLAAGFLGAKVVIAYVWKRSVVISVLVIEFLAIGGGLGGILFAPFLLHKAYKTLSTPPHNNTPHPTPKTVCCSHCNNLIPPNASFCPKCGQTPHQTHEQSNATMKNWISGST
jgi:hypothetical protein